MKLIRIIAGAVAVAAIAAGGIAEAGTASCAPGLRVAEKVAAQAGMSLSNRQLTAPSGNPARWARELSRAGLTEAARAARRLQHHGSDRTAGAFIAAMERTEGACVTNATPF